MISDFSGIFADGDAAVMEDFRQEFYGVGRLITSPFVGFGVAFVDKAVPIPADDDAQSVESAERIIAFSARHPQVTFAYVYAESLAGACEYAGFACRNGKRLHDEPFRDVAGDSEILRRLVLQLGVDIGPSALFEPLQLDYFRSPAHRSPGDTTRAITQRDEAKRPTPTTPIFLWSNRLFSLLAAGSALLLVVVVAVWVRSYFAVDVIRYQPGIEDALRGYAVGWGKGYVATIAEPAKRPAPLGVQWQSLPAAPFDRMWAARNEIFHLLGVRVSSGVGQMNRQVRGLSVHLPCWVPALLSACLPAIWLTTRWRARRLVAPRLEGRHCVRCGYHRCATPDRCPECNSAAAA